MLPSIACCVVNRQLDSPPSEPSFYKIIKPLLCDESPKVPESLVRCYRGVNMLTFFNRYILQLINRFVPFPMTLGARKWNCPKDRDFKTALSKLEEAIELEARDPASNTTTTSQIIANTLHSQQDTSNPTIQGSKRL
ncbi:hypothetical protein SeMB42_g02321 [Synchytrium endobioticum]|uniref:Uncharacterized protein n=1 Tax=Synchytrium endobioticum TaxID=286115 RepID=A0A507DH60_9FUNG|nr:hypothetical protein SeMB42_g02321 [Synchytrium endobioticum]